MTTCMDAKVHEEFFFFTLLARAPSPGKFTYSINVLPSSDKKMLIFSYISLVSLFLFSMVPPLFVIQCEITFSVILGSGLPFMVIHMTEKQKFV